MSTTLKARKNTSSLLLRKNIAEAEIRVLRHLKKALCVKELTNRGRQYIDKMIINRNDELRNIENELGSSEN